MKFLSLLMFVSFVSCSSPQVKRKSSEISIPLESLTATNWFQTSGEARALYLQGYDLARLRFDEAIKKKTAKPFAVIVDIDETILDNSPYQAKLIKENARFPLYWNEWIDKASAQPLPGSLEFLQYAGKKATVFYISNRKEREKEITFEQLRRLGFPLQNKNQLLIQTSTSDKSERRAIVNEKYDVVLLIGDNLNDFDGIFERKSTSEKEKLVMDMESKFGKRFIILPNSLYGDWEGALYNYDYKIPDEEKHNRRMNALRSF